MTEENNKPEIPTATHTKGEVKGNTLHRTLHSTLGKTKNGTMAPMMMKVNAPFSNRTKATNRQKAKKR
jgi:hypothetical protein|tara:strand:- start:838 stop:1041 length:204 start_codon:yes stop_codon:yes gene_type:complete